MQTPSLYMPLSPNYLITQKPPKHRVMIGNNNQFDALRSVVREGKVLIPGSEGFEESLKRWSDTCIKPAVRRKL